MSLADESFDMLADANEAPLAGGGGLLEEEEPPVPLLLPLPSPSPLNRDISEMSSARSYSSGSMELFEALMKTNLERGGSESTLLSDFEIVTVGGTVQRKCNQCTHLNADGAMICQGCQAGLVANLDADLQIALSLQMKEHEMNCVRDAGLFVQSQALSYEIIQVVQSSPDFRNSYGSFPDVDLTLMVARFIRAYQEDFRKVENFGGLEVSFNDAFLKVAYAKAGPDKLDSIRMNGFPADTDVLIRQDYLRSRGWYYSRAQQNVLGFLVAIVTAGDEESDMPETNFFRTPRLASHFLPLVYFNPVSVDNEPTTELFGLLEGCLNVFFRENIH